MEPGKPILFSKSFLFVKKIAYFSTTRSRFWICSWYPESLDCRVCFDP